LSRRAAIAVVLLALLSLAPTAGDVGGCGSEASALDVEQFAADRKESDCLRCRECAIDVPRCRRACDPAAPPETGFPNTCRPLDHDGVVCLRALRAASCDAYSTYVGDVPAIPSECEFCKVVPPTGLPPRFAGDASAEGSTP
jgi:hypothetical protein